MEFTTYVLLFGGAGILLPLMQDKITCVLFLHYPLPKDSTNKKWQRWPRRRTDALFAYGVLCGVFGLMSYAICGGALTYAEVITLEWVRQLIAGAVGVITGAMFYDYTVKDITSQVREINRRYEEDLADKSPAWAAVV